MHRPAWLTRWSSDPGAQAGVLAGAWSIAGSFARGLQPRSVTDQAIATGTVAALNYEITAASWGAIMAAAAGVPGHRPGHRATAVASVAAIAAGVGASFALRRAAPDSFVAAAGEAAGRRLAFVGVAGGAATLWDALLHKRLGLERGLDTTLLPNIATGVAIASTTVLRRNQRARKYGLVAPDRPTLAHSSAGGVAQAALVGVATAAGLTLLTVAEQATARGLEAGMARVIGRDAGAAGAFVAHSITLGALVVIGTAGFSQVVTRAERRDDIIEPAYPEPPTSPYVSSGPRSAMPFDSLGKEGRRFVLMTLSPAQITQVMGEPAIEPVRVVGGYESARDVAERARLTLADMEAVGAFDRSLICVGSPTGVGYLNYSAAEALEYLTRGDCATVVPQYALVPSALALNRTSDGVRLTRLVLEGIRDRLASVPAARRPRVVLLGESLGANVALDVANAPGPHVGVGEFDRLGVSGGLYLGVPFRTRLWQRWRENPDAIDPHGRLLLAAQADELPVGRPGSAAHAMLIHHDDPVNKFSYQMVVQAPWWLGPPATRPPLVPRETRFRPITSFVLALVDLKNGMQSRPGEFVRRGHDYRIELCTGIMRAYGLSASPEQVEAVESSLRLREQEWATRRMVARTFDAARRKVAATLEQWGQTASIDVADLDPTAHGETIPLAMRLGTSGPGA